MFGIYAFSPLLCIGYWISWSIVKDTVDTVFYTETNPLRRPLHDDRRCAMHFWPKHRLRIASYRSHDSQQQQTIIDHDNQMRSWGSFHPPPRSLDDVTPWCKLTDQKSYNAGRTPQKHGCDSVLLESLSYGQWWYTEVIPFVWDATLTYLWATLHFSTKYYDLDRAPQKNVRAAVFLSKN